MADTWPMFVAQEVQLPFAIDPAGARLLALLRLDGLQGNSEDAFDVGRGMLQSAGIGPVSKQVLVQLLHPYRHDRVLIVPLRWVATGPAGALFPQLDGNLELAPVDEDRSTLRLNGAYRPPLATVGARLDQLLLHHVADATIHRLLQDIAAGITALPEASLGFDYDRYEPHGRQP
ncbi:MAG: hypothetical protein ACYC3K_04445 [Candidatus Nanopelagicales bacterium]